MGIERDYLMRQLRMLFDVISKIIRHRRKGENEDAQDEINYFYSCLKIDEDIKTMNIEALFDLLVNIKKLTNEHIEMVAFVLKEQGELSDQRESKLDFFRKSYFYWIKLTVKVLLFRWTGK